ncbi:TetR family transcriptional regulator [Rhodobacterales bacterium HKCCSP123]|nr:TetR family transcriptional regulator [Rhodobacterales bacterium HKCCSP123]
MTADPTEDSLPGNTKVTREDWLRVAMELLVSDGVSEVKILTIGDRLGVSRSSFYWYFKSRKDLLGQLLAEWERTNTGILIAHTRLPAEDIIDAVNGFFLCVVDPAGFNHRLDFAVREWARRDARVRAVIDRSDTARTEALAEMFARHGYPPEEADIRARVLYYQQIGYYALELNETLEERLARVPAYLHAFTGVPPRPDQVAWFADQARARAAP